MLDNLTQRFSQVVKGLRGQARLTDDNIQYLATVTGQDAKKIERLVYSARCAQELNLGASDAVPESA